MKHSQLTGSLFCAALVFFLISCGGNGSKETTGADSTAAADSGAATTEVTTPPNTIITTPQNMMVATHKVADFAKWLASYEGHDSMRLANGIHSYVIGRGLQDTSMVLVAVKVDDLDKAKAFSKSPDLKKAMEKGGVKGAPSINFFTATYQDTAVIGSTIRSRSILTVKDLDAWQKAFDEGKQMRIDNGVTVRVVGHDPDNNKKVSVVTALVDTAKAFAYFKSDTLKKRMEASGVIGKPDRFIFQIVKRY